MIEEMKVEGSRVGIVGGSIAGCAAAIALQRLGCEVEIFERSSGALRDRGSGIGIPIALRDELIDHGYLPEGYATVALPGRRWVAADGSPEGRTLWTIDGASVSNNFPRGIEETVDWVTALMRHMQEKGHTRIAADQAAEDEWCEHVRGFYEGSLISTTKSWFTGYNSNVAGHDTLRHLVYFGGAPKFRERVTEVADNDYMGFRFDSA